MKNIIMDQEKLVVLLTDINKKITLISDRLDKLETKQNEIDECINTYNVEIDNETYLFGDTTCLLENHHKQINNLLDHANSVIKYKERNDTRITRIETKVNTSVDSTKKRIDELNTQQDEILYKVNFHDKLLDSISKTVNDRKDNRDKNERLLSRAVAQSQSAIKESDTTFILATTYLLKFSQQSSLFSDQVINLIKIMGEKDVDNKKSIETILNNIINVKNNFVRFKNEIETKRNYYISNNVINLNSLFPDGIEDLCEPSNQNNNNNNNSN